MISLRIVLPAIPFCALSVAVPLVNRIEPRILGLPFLLFWLAFWVAVTPVALWASRRLARGR
jgi:hypothetical protein